VADERPSTERKDGIGWYLSFALIAVLAFIAIGTITGQEALAAAARVFWNGFALVVNSLFRMFGGLLGLIAKGVGWRRATRIANVIGGIGLGYAASVVLSEDAVQKARGWRGKLRATINSVKTRWQNLPLLWKLVIVAALIASQVYLHTVLVIFPIAFLVPVVRKLWIRTADLIFGVWYWKTFGTWHRRLVAWLKKLPGVRAVIGWVRLTRIRYLTAWRLWKYHPCYFDCETGRRQVSFVEPLRLWWGGELDGYIGRPLLAGPMHRPSPPSLEARSLGLEVADERHQLPRTG
jgi:hypothetical protein